MNCVDIYFVLMCYSKGVSKDNFSMNNKLSTSWLKQHLIMNVLKRCSNGCNEGFQQHIDGLVQERRNSGALAMELRLSCTNPSTYFLQWVMIHHLISGLCIQWKPKNRICFRSWSNHPCTRREAVCKLVLLLEEIPKVLNVTQNVLNMFTGWQSLNRIFDTFRPGQHGRHSAYDIFKCIFDDRADVWI